MRLSGRLGFFWFFFFLFLSPSDLASITHPNHTNHISYFSPSLTTFTPSLINKTTPTHSQLPHCHTPISSKTILALLQEKQPLFFFFFSFFLFSFFFNSHTKCLHKPLKNIWAHTMPAPSFQHPSTCFQQGKTCPSNKHTNHSSPLLTTIFPTNSSSSLASQRFIFCAAHHLLFISQTTQGFSTTNLKRLRLFNLLLHSHTTCTFLPAPFFSTHSSTYNIFPHVHPRLCHGNIALHK